MCRIGWFIGYLLLVGCQSATESVATTNSSNAPPQVRDTQLGQVTEGGRFIRTASTGLATLTEASQTAQLRFYLHQPPQHGSVMVSEAGAIDYRHDGSESRSDTFQWYASNGYEHSAIATATFEILAINDPPVWHPTPCLETPQEEAITALLQGNDSDDQQLHFTLLTPPRLGSLTLDSGSGQFHYRPNPAAARGVDHFTFRLSDAAGASVEGEQWLLVRQRLMPLGDSITAGVVSAAPADVDGDGNLPPMAERVGYRQPLQQRLIAAGYRLDFVGPEQAGNSATLPLFDPDHAGEPGMRDDELAQQLYTLLSDYPADLILLHIGTNDLNQSPNHPTAPEQDVADLLDAFDRWREDSGQHPTLFIARIIDRYPRDSNTTLFNDRVVDSVVLPRRDSDLIIVDQERGAGLDYAVDLAEDSLWPQLHPTATGYDKIAAEWYRALQQSGRLARCPP